jgi:hydrogenase/urease accessory protein HupE
MTTRAGATAGLAVGLLLAATPARAHLVDTGLGAFYDGAAHLFVTPSDLLLVLALALLAGRQPPPVARAIVLAAPLAWLAGGVLGAAAQSGAGLAVAVTLSYGMVAAWVAIGLRLPARLAAALAAVVAGLHGWTNGAAFAPGDQAVQTLAGAVVAVAVLLTVVAGQVATVRAFWAGVVVRAGASWIAATAILMLAWTLRGASLA